MAAKVASQKMGEKEINLLNQEMRSQPWYQQWFQSKGLDQNRVKLTEDQRDELTMLAAQHGMELGDRMKFDAAGNINQKGGFAGMPTWAKVAIAAAAVAGTGGALGAAGVGPMAGMMGGTSGAAPGLAASVAAPAATEAGILGGAGVLGTAGTVSSATGTGLSTMDRVGALMRGGSKAVGSATEAAAQRQLAADQMGLQANAQNIQGENAFQSQQNSMAQLEAQQQEQARKNLYRASVMKNPTVSPENRSGAPTFSAEMLEGMTNLEKQALLRTAEESQYTTGKMRKPREYTPYSPTIGTPSTMQKVGNWLAPALSIADLGMELY